MAKIDILRRIIREEVEKAIKKEMPGILREIKITEPSKKMPIKEEVIKNPFIPGTLNTEPFIPAKHTNFVGKDPLSQILAETAVSMGEQDLMAFTSDDVMADPTNFFQPTNPQVGNVESMLQTARPSTSLEMVQLNEVPDFTDLMTKMIKND